MRGMRQGQSAATEGAAVSLEDFYSLAAEKLPQATLDYYTSGAEDERCLRSNLTALQSYCIVPRMLRDVSRLNTSVNVLGMEWRYPFMVAPMALQGMAHPDGEKGMARAAAFLGVPMALSTISNTSLGDLATTGNEKLMFQLYALKDREVTRKLIEEAEQQGYKALVLTVDAPELVSGAAWCV